MVVACREFIIKFRYTDTWRKYSMPRMIVITCATITSDSPHNESTFQLRCGPMYKQRNIPAVEYKYFYSIIIYDDMLVTMFVFHGVKYISNSFKGTQHLWNFKTTAFFIYSHMSILQSSSWFQWGCTNYVACILWRKVCWFCLYLN